MCSGTARLPALDPVVHAGHLPLQSKTSNNVSPRLDRCLPMLMVPLREKWEGKTVSSVEAIEHTPRENVEADILDGQNSH
jgi:hypothetical protein